MSEADLINFIINCKSEKEIQQAWIKHNKNLSLDLRNKLYEFKENKLRRLSMGLAN